MNAVWVYRSLFVAAALFLTALGVRAQTATPQSQIVASIEVAVVKPHPATVMHNNFSFQRNRFELEDQPLLKLISPVEIGLSSNRKIFQTLSAC